MRKPCQSRYIDPNTNSLNFQMEIASFVRTSLWIIRLYQRIGWLMVGGWLIKQPKNNPPSWADATTAFFSHDPCQQRRPQSNLIPAGGHHRAGAGMLLGCR